MLRFLVPLLAVCSWLQQAQACADSRENWTEKQPSIRIFGEPKSGTTWLEFVVREVLMQGCTNHTQCTLVVAGKGVSQKKNHFICVNISSELLVFNPTKKHHIPYLGHSENFDMSHPDEWSDTEVEHMAYKTLRNAGKGTKWFFIFRDPRAVTISICFHRKEHCDVATQVSRDVRGIAEWINLRHRFALALRKAAPRQVHLLYYEEMKSDELGMINGIAEFLGLFLSSGQVEFIRNETTFSAMKKMGAEVRQDGAEHGKVRKGSSCGYAEEVKGAAAQITRDMRGALGPELNARWNC